MPLTPRAGAVIAGAMSGTSADGVDVALVHVTGRGLGMGARLIRHDHNAYDAPLRQAIFRVRETGTAKLSDLARIGREVSLAYARAVNETLDAAGMSAGDLGAVAAHGQTLFHNPPDTIQWLDPALVAAEVRCAVVSDFRRADCAAGGQGAPLVPFADYILFRHPMRNRVLLNIGGIANVTFLKAGCRPEEVVAFDTGPGNCVSDHVCRTRGPFELSWDVGGSGASNGRVIAEVAERFLRLAYLAAGPPKSTDGPAMTAAFEAALWGVSYEMNDLLATAAYVTAATVAAVVTSRPGFGSDFSDRFDLIVSGGGVHNRAIMGWLRSLLGSEVTVRVTDSSVPPDAKEAVAFALLGAATLDGEPSNLPSATGARRAVVLGSITPKP